MNVPKGWAIKKVKDVIKIANGQVSPKEMPFCDYIHIGPENVQSGSGRLRGLKPAKELGLRSGKYLFDENCLVYSKIRPNLNKVCFPRFKGICSADMYPIWARSGVDISFLYFFFLSSYFVYKATVCSSRTGLPKINREELGSLDILLPPFPEQKKIADILSCWDEAIQKTEKLIIAKKKFKNGVMQKLLLGKVRFKSFKDKGDFRKLKGLIKEISIRNKNNKTNIVLSVTNTNGFVIQTEHFDKSIASADISNYKIVKQGQFGFNPSRVNVGSIAMLEKKVEGALSPMYTVFETVEDSLLLEYMKHFIKSSWFNGHVRCLTQGSVRDSLSFDALEQIKIFVPSIKEQRRVADILSCIDEEVALLERQRVALNEQKKGLMQKLLTGQIRVKV